MGNGGPLTEAPLLADGPLGGERDDVAADIVDGVLRDGGSDEGVVVGLVVANLEPEAFEQQPQDVVGGVEVGGLLDDAAPGYTDALRTSTRIMRSNCTGCHWFGVKRRWPQPSARCSHFTIPGSITVPSSQRSNP